MKAIMFKPDIWIIDEYFTLGQMKNDNQTDACRWGQIHLNYFITLFFPKFLMPVEIQGPY